MSLPLCAVREAGGQHGVGVVAEPPTQPRRTAVARVLGRSLPQGPSSRTWRSGYTWMQARVHCATGIMSQRALGGRGAGRIGFNHANQPAHLRDHVRVVIVMTVGAPDVAGALAAA
jgi:hypothetical protein